MARETMRIHVNDEIPDAKAHVCFVVKVFMVSFVSLFQQL